MSARAKVADGAQPLVGDAARERMLAGLPVTERRLRVASVSTAVLEGGDGPPLVLLHGGIECGGAIWAPVISRLAESYRLVVPDEPGLGESEPFARLDAAAFAEWLAALLEQTGPERPTLIAHSLGGSLAARFAAAHGDLLRRLVICAAPGIGPYRMPLRLRLVAIRFALRPSERNAERFDRFALLDLDRTRERDPEWFEAFTRYTLSRARIKHVKRTMQQLIKTGTRPVPDSELRRVAIPTALLWGRHDRMVPLGLAEGASARLGWPLHVVDDAAHAPQIEQREGFLRALRTALDIGADHYPIVRRREMPNVSRETASEKIALEGLDVRLENLEGGYSVCFESHTADADLAELFRGLPDDRAQLPRWGYVIKGKVGFRFADREETYAAGDAYYVPPGHTPVHYAGAEIVEFSPTEILGETIPVVMKNLQAAGVEVGSQS